MDEDSIESLQRQIEVAQAELKKLLRQTQEELLMGPIPTELVPTPQPVKCAECKIRRAAVKTRRVVHGGRPKDEFYYAHINIWDRPGPFCNECEREISYNMSQYYDDMGC